MNHSPLARNITTAILFTATVYAAFQLARGVTFISMARFLVLTIPIWFALLLKLRPYWIGILLGLSASRGREIPIALFEMIPIQLIFSILMMGVLVLDMLITHHSIWPKTKAGRAHLLLFLIAMAWYIIERPGSYRMGAESAGGSLAIQIVGGLLLFPIAAHELKNGIDVRKNMITALILSFSFYLIAIGQMYNSRGMEFAIGKLSLMSFWAFSPLLLAMLMKNAEKKRMYLYSADIWAICILLSGLVAMHRSRIVMATGVVLIIAWAYGRIRRYVAIVFAGALIALSAFMIGGIPPRFLRSASLFLPASLVHQSAIGQRMELGYESPFRADMIRRGIERIRARPIFGRGTSISVEEAYSIVSAGTQTQGYEKYQDFLELGGGYHNMFITIAVYYGITGLLLFSIVIATSTRQAMAFIVKNISNNPLTYCLVVASLACMYAYMVQFTINGGSPDLRKVLLYTGILHGIWIAHLSGNSSNIKAEPQKTRLALR